MIHQLCMLGLLYGAVCTRYTLMCSMQVKLPNEMDWHWCGLLHLGESQLKSKLCSHLVNTPSRRSHLQYFASIEGPLVANLVSILSQVIKLTVSQEIMHSI